MIVLTKLNGIRFVLNDELIETIHENPDTTVHLQNGIYYIVKENMADIIDLIVAFRKRYANQELGERLQDNGKLNELQD